MSEFAALTINDTTVEKCRIIREAFSEALTAIKQHVTGRELALVTTKLQEACMWAIRMDPANQHPTQPGSEATESQLDRAPIGGQRHG